LDLLQFGGVEQDRGPRLRQLAQERIDLALGPDVDAAGWIEADHRPDPAGDPPSDRYLLLVPTRQAADLALRPRIDLEAFDRPIHRLLLLAQVD